MWLPRFLRFATVLLLITNCCIESARGLDDSAWVKLSQPTADNFIRSLARRSKNQLQAQLLSLRADGLEWPNAFWRSYISEEVSHVNHRVHFESHSLEHTISSNVLVRDIVEARGYDVEVETATLQHFESSGIEYPSFAGNVSRTVKRFDMGLKFDRSYSIYQPPCNAGEPCDRPAELIPGIYCSASKLYRAEDSDFRDERVLPMGSVEFTEQVYNGVSVREYIVEKDCDPDTVTEIYKDEARLWFELLGGTLTDAKVYFVSSKIRLLVLPEVFLPLQLDYTLQLQAELNGTVAGIESCTSFSQTTYISERTTEYFVGDPGVDLFDVESDCHSDPPTPPPGPSNFYDGIGFVYPSEPEPTPSSSSDLLRPININETRILGSCSDAAQPQFRTAIFPQVPIEHQSFAHPPQAGVPRSVSLEINMDNLVRPIPADFGQVCGFGTPKPQSTNESPTSTAESSTNTPSPSNDETPVESSSLEETSTTTLPSTAATTTQESSVESQTSNSVRSSSQQTDSSASQSLESTTAPAHSASSSSQTGTSGQPVLTSPETSELSPAVSHSVWIVSNACLLMISFYVI